MFDSKNIEDSYKAAKAIQDAFLPSGDLITYLLPDNFIIYMPKDVVSGDFYWVEQVNEIVIFAVGDCTGHGVPGAIMRELCRLSLNKSLKEYGMVNPGHLLDMTREILAKMIQENNRDIKEGMDIALCSLEGTTLFYSGANNPLWMIQGNELKVIKGTPQAIGICDNPTFFEVHEIKLNKGDIIYLFSDGFQDQFGGPKGKKLMIGGFKGLIETIKSKSMIEQKQLLEKYIIDWKGKEDQTDDICILGVKV